VRIHARLGDPQWIAEHYGGLMSSRYFRSPPDYAPLVAFRRDGPQGLWRTLLAQTQATGIDHLVQAGYFTELRDTESAIASLARAVDAHEFRMVYACVDPVFDPLRSNPRFQAALAKVCGSQKR